MAVLGILGVLLGLLLPSLGAAQRRAAAVGCASNLRQWQQAWMMYADDASGNLVPNLARSVDGEWRGTPESWAGTNHARFDRDSVSLASGALWRYLGIRPARLGLCPADRARVESGTSARLRSYALNGNCHGRTGELQHVVRTLGEILRPSELFTFIDEHEDSIDDGHFLVWAAPDLRWVNLPAGRHGALGLWTAADGQVVRTRWRTPRSWVRHGTYWREAVSPGERADLATLQQWILPILPPDPSP